jgi:hypothetical protein
MPQPNSVSTVELDNLDDFLPMPGADNIVSPEQKNSIFSKPGSVDMSFLDNKSDEEEEKEEKETSKSDEPDADILNSMLEDPEEKGSTSSKAGRKGAMIETFSKMIEDGDLIPFDDDKSMEDYTVTDWKELIKANFDERERKVKEQTPKEFYESLPEELRVAAEYVARGGQDMKTLFSALAHVQETKDLDVNDEHDQIQIARQYLQESDFGTPDEIEEEISSWQDLNVLHKKAAQFKPKLDKKRESIVQKQIEQQEARRAEQAKAQKAYVDNVYNTLKDGSLNGLKLDKKTQNFLFQELVTPKYPSMNGQQTNLLGHLMEHYHYKEPRFDLIAEATWLLSDPDAYRAEIRKQAKNEAVDETARKLRTEEGRRLASNAVQEEPAEKTQKKLTRQPNNIFKR